MFIFYVFDLWVLFLFGLDLFVVHLYFGLYIHFALFCFFRALYVWIYVWIFYILCHWWLDLCGMSVYLRIYKFYLAIFVILIVFILWLCVIIWVYLFLHFYLWNCFYVCWGFFCLYLGLTLLLLLFFCHCCLLVSFCLWFLLAVNLRCPIYPFICHGHLNYFHLLAIVSNTVMIGVYKYLF